MKQFVLYKVAIISLLFTLPVDVVSRDYDNLSMSLEQAWKILNVDCKLEIPPDADLEKLDKKLNEFRNYIESVPKAFLVVKDNIKKENAYRWLANNVMKCKEAAKEQIRKNQNITAVSIINNIKDLWSLQKDLSYRDSDQKIIDEELMKLMNKVIEEMNKPQSQPQPVEQWFNDHLNVLTSSITFYLNAQFAVKAPFAHEFFNVDREAVWEYAIQKIIEKDESYKKMNNSNKEILKIKINQLIIEIEQELNKRNRTIA